MKQVHNKADVMAWLVKAQDDLRFAESVLNDTFYSHVCFICQQSAEKALKGLIYSLQEDFSLAEIRKLKTHNLGLLLKLAKQRGVSIPQDVNEACAILDRYYMSTIGLYTKEIAHEAFAKAKEIFGFVDNLLQP